MKFVKGQSGNPGGRPKAVPFAVVLARGLDEVKAGKTTRERIAETVLELAVKGNLEAVKWIVDRVDGRAPERLEAEVTVAQPVPDATIAAVLARAAARNGVGVGPP